MQRYDFSSESASWYIDVETAVELASSNSCLRTLVIELLSADFLKNIA